MGFKADLDCIDCEFLFLDSFIDPLPTWTAKNLCQWWQVLAFCLKVGDPFSTPISQRQKISDLLSGHRSVLPFCFVQELLFEVATPTTQVR